MAREVKLEAREQLPSQAQSQGVGRMCQVNLLHILSDVWLMDPRLAMTESL